MGGRGGGKEGEKMQGGGRERGGTFISWKAEQIPYVPISCLKGHSLVVRALRVAGARRPEHSSSWSAGSREPDVRSRRHRRERERERESDSW